MVSYDEEADLYAVGNTTLIPYLHLGVNALRVRAESLEEKVARLEKEVAELKKHL